jgi:hypothetical protein
MRLYGITVDQYDEMLAAQGGVCALCGKKPGKVRLGVDHDHTLKAKYGVVWVRALIHNRCNRSLAPFEHDDETLTRLAAYATLIVQTRKKYEKENQ